MMSRSPHRFLLGAIAFLCSETLLLANGFENLLPSPSFETDSDSDGVADGWRKSIHNGAEGSFSLDKAHTHHEVVSQHIVHASDNSAWVRASADGLPARPEKTYQVTGWVKATGPWTVILYEFIRDSKTYETHTIASGKETDWQQIGTTITTKKNAVTFKLSLVTHGKGEAWFDDFVLGVLDQIPSLRTPQLSEAPVVDGKLDDKGWADAATFSRFFVLGGNGATASPDTTVKIGFREGVLYVGWHCPEPRVGDLAVEGPPRWTHDTVEFFLGPGKHTDGYYQFGITPAGGKLEGHRLERLGNGYYVDWYSAKSTVSEAPKVSWDGAAVRAGDHWTAEMAINVHELSDYLQPGQVWRLQFARSRKVTGKEENSCWSYTPGATFHTPDRFGRTVFPLFGDSKAVTIKAPAYEPPTDVRIIPHPQRLREARRAPRELRSPVRIAVKDPGNPPAQVETLARILGKLGLSIALVDHTAARKATLTIGGPDESKYLGRASGELLNVSKTMQDWQAGEAYGLDTTAQPIALAATGERGLLYGIHTLRQLLKTDGKHTWIQQVQITDWPSMPWRGWHLISPENSAALEEARKVIDIMAALKMNWVAFQIDNRLQYTRDPDLGREGALTKDELRGLVEYAEAHLMEVIPMTQCWSHFNGFLRKEKYRHLAEVQEPDPNARWKYWNYCPRHPDVHTMLFGMIEEQLECFPNARFFHCGLDEITFEPIGVCERCKGTAGGDLLAEEIGRLHKFVRSKGLTMCMWGDQLLTEHNGGQPHDTALALNKIPHDIVIFDWHYGRKDEFPSVKFFRDQGFPVVASGWYEPENVMTFSQTAADQGVLGYGGTTWYGIHRIHNEVRLIHAIPLTAENTWSPSSPTLDALTYRPAEVFQELGSGGGPLPGGTYIPIGIGSYADRTLEDDERHLGWLGLGHDHDLSVLPTGRQWLAGIPFEIIPAGRMQCIVLAKDGDDERALPSRAWQIPVNAKAQSLAFLQTCSRPPRFSRHIYDRKKVNPGDIARYIAYYADGETAEITLKWNVNISDWNSQLGSAQCRQAWTGRTHGGARAQLEVFEWQNPRPDVEILALDLVSLQSTVRPTVLAITACVPVPRGKE